MTRFIIGSGWFDCETRELRNEQGDVETLKPKNAEVLEFLIENRDQVVTRDSFFDEVWRDVAVSEQALNKIITELRNSLGDSARDSRYIKTFTKKGYKWVHDETYPETVDPTPAAVEPIQTAEPDPSRPTPAHNPTRRGPSIPILLTALFLMVVGFWFLNRDDRVETDSQPEVKPVFLALLPFKNDTGDQEKTWIEAGLRDMVSRSLEELTVIEIIDDNDLKEGMRVAGIRTGEEPTDEQTAHLEELFHFDSLITTQVGQEGEFYSIRYQIRNRNGVEEADLKADSLQKAAQLMAFSLAGRFDGKTAEMGMGNRLSENEFVNETYAKGVQFLESGELPKAVNHFKVCLDHEPSMAWPKLQLAAALRLQDQTEEAKRLYLTLLEQAQTLGNPKLEADVLRNLGLLERRAGNWQPALDFSRRGFNTYQSMHYVQGEILTSNQIATILARLGEFGQAEETVRANYQKAASLGNKYIYYSTAIKLATILSLQNRFEEAEPIYREALKLVEALSDHRNQASILENLGNIYLMRKDYEPAKTHYQQALNINRDYYNQRGVASCIQNLGAIHLMEERYNDAHSFFSRALNISRDVGDQYLENQILYNLGESRLNGDRKDEAEDYFQQAVSLAKTLENEDLLLDAGSRLALLYLFQKRSAEAAAQLANLQDLADEHAGYHFTAALAAYEDTQWSLAVTYMEKAKKLAEDDWSEENEARLQIFKKAAAENQKQRLGNPNHIPDF